MNSICDTVDQARAPFTSGRVRLGPATSHQVGAAEDEREDHRGIGGDERGGEADQEEPGATHEAGVHERRDRRRSHQRPDEPAMEGHHADPRLRRRRATVQRRGSLRGRGSTTTASAAVAAASPLVAPPASTRHEGDQRGDQGSVADGEGRTGFGADARRAGVPARLPTDQERSDAHPDASQPSAEGNRRRAGEHHEQCRGADHQRRARAK